MVSYNKRPRAQKSADHHGIAVHSLPTKSRPRWARWRKMESPPLTTRPSQRMTRWKFDDDYAGKGTLVTHRHTCLGQRVSICISVVKLIEGLVYGRVAGAMTDPSDRKRPLLRLGDLPHIKCSCASGECWVMDERYDERMKLGSFILRDCEILRAVQRESVQWKLLVW